MYLRFVIDGALEEIVRNTWPEASVDELLRDYENEYEWVWLTLSGLNIRLNISREHEWGQEANSYPIYISAFELKNDKYVDVIPDAVITRFHKKLGCKIELFEGRYYVDVEEKAPIKTLV